MIKRVIIIVFLFLFGCSAPKKEISSKKIIIWHWMTDRQGAFEELANKYKDLTGIEVEFKLFFPPDIYSQKVIAAARAGTLPDIFGVLGEKKMFASFIKAGYILNLAPFIKDWQERFIQQTLQVNTFKKGNIYGVEPGIYGIPIDSMNIQFLYNKRLFKKAGLNPNRPPKDFKEFIKYAKILKEKLRVNGFVCGWGEVWLIYCLVTEFAINIMGKDKFFDTLRGKVPYTDPEWIKVFSLFKEMRDAQILAPNIVTMINKEAEESFALGKAGFSFNGSWCINVYKKLNPDLEYGVFPLPTVSDKKSVKIWGGAGSSFVVNANSKNKTEAIKFLKWLTEPEQQKFLMEKTLNLPAVKIPLEEVSPILKEFLDDTGNLTHPNVWPLQEDSRVVEVINRGVQQIIMGLKTPEQVALEVQKAKERVLLTKRSQ